METGMMRLYLVVAAALAVVPMAVQAGEKEDIIAAASIAFDPYRGTTSAMDGDWAKPIYDFARDLAS